MTDLAEPYISALRRLAEAAGLGPRELARRTSLPFSTVQHALAGDRQDITLTTAAALAQALGASLVLRKGRVSLARSG